MAERRSLMAMLKDHWPTRESVQRNRFLKPFAAYLADPSLWRLSRRSVPRGVALGLFVGIVIPVAHMFVAALVAIPARANVAIASATTLIVNPLTILPMYLLAYRIGSWELRHEQLIDPGQAQHASGELAEMLFWIHRASGPIAVGILTLAVSSAAIGYFVSAVGWRWWRGSKWRERRYRKRGLRPPAEG